MTELMKIVNLHKAFGTNQVLNGINTTIQNGEVVVVIGPSGSGKSTFLRCLNLLEVPTKGSIIFEGIDLTDAKTDIFKVRENLGMVFQSFNLFPHKTVMENICLAPVKYRIEKEDAAKENGMRLLQQVGLADKAEYILVPCQEDKSSGLQLPVLWLWNLT